MLNIDDLLWVLQNPTRRRILELLSQETHYPLQIARELGISQQAVMKHLKVLEEYGLVRSFEEPSDTGGPPRKYYAPVKGFSIRIDAGPGIFDTVIIERKANKKTEPHKQEYYHGFRERKKEEINIQKLKKLACDIRRLDNEIEEMETQRLKLLEERERLLESAREMVSRMVSDYMERRLIYYLLEEGPATVEDLSETFDRRIKSLKKLQQEIENRYGLRWLFEDWD